MVFRQKLDPYNAAPISVQGTKYTKSEYAKAANTQIHRGIKGQNLQICTVEVF